MEGLSFLETVVVDMWFSVYFGGVLGKWGKVASVDKLGKGCVTCHLGLDGSGGRECGFPIELGCTCKGYSGSATRGVIREVCLFPLLL